MVAAILRRNLGEKKSFELLTQGLEYTSDEALDLGLINRVVPDDKLESEATELLERLAAGPTTSYAGAKRLLNRRLYADLAGQLEAEADQQRDQGQTKDFVEGVIAFVEKRPASFTHR